MFCPLRIASGALPVTADIAKNGERSPHSNGEPMLVVRRAHLGP